MVSLFFIFGDVGWSITGLCADVSFSVFVLMYPGLFYFFNEINCYHLKNLKKYFYIIINLY